MSIVASDMAEWRRSAGGVSGNGARHGQGEGGEKQAVSSSSMRRSRLRPPPGRSVPLELLSSPSRGLDDGADPSQNLTNADTQERFAEHISDRIRKYIERYGRLHQQACDLFPVRMPGDEQYSAVGLAKGSAALQSMQEILLLIRRLREGCVASARVDSFTRRIYLLSMAISLLAGDSIQLNATLARLVQLFASDPTMDESSADIDDLLSASPSRFTQDLVNSILLLWNSVTGGQSERLGGHHSKRRSGSSSAFWETLRTLQSPPYGPHVGFVIRVHKALAHDDVLQVRAALLESADNVWHRALLSRVVEEKRGLAWSTLKKAYLHAPADSRLLGEESSWPVGCGPNDWLERVLLIDAELIRPAHTNTTATAPSTTPDSWDDDLDGLQAALQRSHISDDHAEVRAQRLAQTLDHYRVPCSSGEISSPESNALERWRASIVKQNGVSVIKLR